MYQYLFAGKYSNIVYPRDKHKRALRGVKRSPDTFTDDDAKTKTSVKLRFFVSSSKATSYLLLCRILHNSTILRFV